MALYRLFHDAPIKTAIRRHHAPIMPDISTILLAALPILLAITLHEAAHAKAAQWCGDSTAYALGRVTINPLPHIDLMGTVVVPLLLVALSGATHGATPIFGWAKPVPVNIHQLRNPLRDQFWVAGAGPLANVVMLVGWWGAWLVAEAIGANSGVGQALGKMALVGVLANLSLFLINMLPILPLDGGRIVQSLLPRHLAYRFSATERYGFFILIFLVFSHALSFIFTPIMRVVISWL